nr:leucine rich repeat and calponin y [Hymenolepis microstoma]
MKNLEELNNQICQLPKSLTKLEYLENLEVSKNPLIFPPYKIVSRGLAHILAYLDRNDPEVIQTPPPLPKRTRQTQHQDLQEQQSSLSNRDNALQRPSSPTSYQEEDEHISSLELSEDDSYEIEDVFKEDYSTHEYEQVTGSSQYRMSRSHSSFHFSQKESRPSSAMAAISSKFSRASSNPEWSESDFSKRHPFRRMHSQPEFYERVVMTTQSSPSYSLSLTSLSDNQNANQANENLALSQSHKSWRVQKDSRQHSLHSYRNNLHMSEQKIMMEHRRFTSKNHDRPMPPPRNNFSASINTRKSKLYVRRTTPSPPPRRSRLSGEGGGSISSEENVHTPSPPPPSIPVRQIPPLAPRRSVDTRRTDRNRPSLRAQRSFSPSTVRLDEDLQVERSKVWRVENTKLPTLQRQKTRASSGYMASDSEDEISTDSSCEDLPVPHLQGHTASPSITCPNSIPVGVPTQLNRRPGQLVSPPAATISNQQQHRYLKNGKGQVGTQSKVNTTPQQFPQRNGNLLHRNVYYNDTYITPHSSSRLSATSSYENKLTSQFAYPHAQNQQYDELWHTTAENLRMLLISHLNIPLPANPNALALELRSGIYIALFINDFLGFKAVKRIYEVTGSSWQSRARQNLLSCREIMLNLGVPKHRLFSVTRVLQADPTVGLYGLFYSLQTLMDVWASRPSTFLPGGLGVREKLTNQPVTRKSLLGDITTNRKLRHQHKLQDPHHHRNRTYSNPNFYSGIAGGVFSDV